MQFADVSPLQRRRAEYQPKLPGVLRENGPFVQISGTQPTQPKSDGEALKKLFPNTFGAPLADFTAAEKKSAPPINVALIFSGGQAPGGHNVAAGLYDAMQALNPENQLFGFLGGPSGLIDNKYQLLDRDTIDACRNTGGFDMIGSGRTKLETPEQFEQVAATCRKHGINAIVVVGGDDSNTNACMLAEYFLTHQIDIQVVGCPKTIDGDLKNEHIQTSFGFDTATKIYSELVGNILRDAKSARKYWHFIKLMGRSASHIALECALRTHPNICLISEEAAAQKRTLRDIVDEIAEAVRRRSEKGMNYGVVLVPEGLIEFIPEIKSLIEQLNDLLAQHEQEFSELSNAQKRIDFIIEKLAEEPARLFASLPDNIKAQLTMDRDPHGNVQVSRIETEKLLIEMVEQRLKQLKAEGKFSGSFSAQNHFFGYEGRCAAPSNFDADYCYSLGYSAACLAANGKTGYIAAVGGLEQEAEKWRPGGIPLTMMMNLERRKGKEVPVIQKALVELDGEPFKAFAAHRSQWRDEDHYCYPGPIQYFGPPEVTDEPAITLKLELL